MRKKRGKPRGKPLASLEPARMGHALIEVVRRWFFASGPRGVAGRDLLPVGGASVGASKRSLRDPQIRKPSSWHNIRVMVLLKFFSPIKLGLNRHRVARAGVDT